ncbi:MAG: HD domain-containing protein [Dehalococcoidia bacterium]|nr:HD domain-containing protein [Dehalococcoidia bacterium]
MAALFGPGAAWSGERLTIVALIPLGAALEQARMARGSSSGPPLALGASMAAGALSGVHGAAVVAPFVALSGLRSSARGRLAREAVAHTCAALAFGAVFLASEALSFATEWPRSLLPGAAGAAMAASLFAVAERPGARTQLRKPATWEGAALSLAIWALLGVMATGIAAVSRALGPAGVALFAMPGALAQARLAQTVKESLRMERALNAMRRQVELAQARAAQDLGALERLAAAVDERCYGDADRSRRVGELAVALLREIPLDEGALSEEELYRAALLRDIGLLRVSEHILRSPGALAPDERLAIMAHPEDGFWFLADHGLSDSVRQIVRGHHERYDGGGYPRRLRSLSIPLGARILAVADALVAMLSARAYRDALPLEMALQELRLGRGTQFDPNVVDACLALVQTGGLPWLDRRTSSEARRIA